MRALGRHLWRPSLYTESSQLKKILVTGGTGAMGKYLVPMLAAESSYQVFVTSRSARKSNLPNVVYLKGNAKDVSWIETILSTFEFDVVFDFMMYAGNEFQERCCLLLDNCAHYFYLSSYRVMGEDVVLNEDCPIKLEALALHPEYELDRYGLRKGHEEKALHGSGRRNYTIIRPSMTFSNDRFQFFSGDNFDVLRAAKGVPTLLPESAVNSITNLTYGKNVAKMLTALVDKPEAMGHTFHAVTKSMTWGEIGEAFKKVFGMSFKVVPDAEYMELVDLEDGRIFDRFRTRNISNKKILSVTGLTDDDFGTLEDSLREAWASSDQGRYRASRASMGAMARFDQATNSQINLASCDEKSKKEYLLSKKSLSEKIRIGDFWVRPNVAYWEISLSDQASGGVTIRRNDAVVTSNAWLNFRNFNFLCGLEKGADYKIKMSITSYGAFDLKAFFHFFGKNITRLTSVHVVAGFNNVELFFRPSSQYYSDVAITATEMREDLEFKIDNICIERV